MISGERISRYSLREYATGWLKATKHETRASALDFYRKSVEKALAVFKVGADLPLTELSRDAILDYSTHLAETVAPNTANHHLKASRGASAGTAGEHPPPSASIPCGIPLSRCSGTRA